MESATPAPAARAKMKNGEGEAESEGEELVESDSDSISGVSDDDDISKIRRAHLEQTRAMSRRGRRPGPRSRTSNMSYKRKLEAVKTFHDFTKKLKQDTGITIRSLKGNSVLGLDGILTSESEESSGDGISEEEFEVNPQAVEELNAPDESYIDPETGDFVEGKKQVRTPTPPPAPPPALSTPSPPVSERPSEPKTLTIADILDDKDLDLSKPVEIAEMDGGELEKTAEELLELKEGESSQDFDITEKLKEMGEISVKPVRREEDDASADPTDKPDADDEKKAGTAGSSGALNVRRNIREVMDEKQLDASTLAAQRQESERLARVQEQQRIIREVQRQIAMNRQNKAHARTMALLQGGGSLLKKGQGGHKLNLPNTVLVKLASSDSKKKQGQVEVTRVPKSAAGGAASPSLGPKLGKLEPKTDKKEVVEIVDSSSSGEESSSSSSDSDDCIMLSDSEVPPSPEPDDDPGNSGMHVNDTYNVPDEQGRVTINIGHPENEEDIFLAPQIARIIKPHQIGGVRFLFDNIIESVERFSTSTGFGCILAHSMGLGKTLQIVCFCDIFLRHTSSKTVLCIMPINTLQNWVAEFNMWLPMDATNSQLSTHGEVRPRNFPIYVLNDSHKTLAMRAKVVQEWKTSGGVLMIGYELYRLLSMKKDKKPRRKKKTDPPAPPKPERGDKTEAGKEGDDTQGSSDNTTQSKPEAPSEARADGAPKPEDKLEEGEIRMEPGENKLEPGEIRLEPGEIRPDPGDDKKDDDQTDEEKKLLDEMYEALVKPGPDLVICDEGHRIKNSHSNISYALKQMRTKRRIVLTGYPLQNNLLEYWCMVDFVRPNYLGTKTEFSNMFERPIQNGQCIDSTPQDIRLMRYRAHVLHSLLVGFVQRRSHAVLQSTLPQKEEYVLLVRMTPLQRQLYDTFMNEVVRTKSVPNPLKAFAICCKIWNHPDVLYYFLRKRSETNAAIEEDLDLEEIGGTSKARAAGRGPGRRAAPGRPPKAKPARADKRGATKKPAATIPPNTSSGPPKPYPEGGYGNQYPYGPPNAYGPPQYGPPQNDQNPYPPYPGYQNHGQGYYPPHPPHEGGYNQNYQGNYYQQQPQPQPPYSNNTYPNQYPQNNPGAQSQEYSAGYNANNTNNYWGNEGYYGQPGYNYNQQYPNSQPPQEYQGNAQPHPGFNSQPYQQPFPGAPPPSYNGPPNQPYPNNQTPEQYSAQNRPPGPGYPPNPNYPTGQSFPPYPPTQAPDQATYPNGPPESGYPAGQPYPAGSYGNNSYDNYNPQAPGAPYAGYDPNRPAPSTYPNYEGSGNSTPGAPNASATEPPPNTAAPTEPAGAPPPEFNNHPSTPAPYAQNPTPSSNSNGSTSASTSAPATPAPPFNYESQNLPTFPNHAGNGDTKFPLPYPGYPSQMVETKPPLGSAEDPLPSWPLSGALKSELDVKPLASLVELKAEIKSESDSEVKIEDLDTKKIIQSEDVKAEKPKPIKDEGEVDKKVKLIPKEPVKSDEENSEDESPKKPKKKGNNAAETKGKKTDNKSKPKPKSAKTRAKNAKDRKASKEKEKNDASDSEGDSEKEEKRDKEEEAALAKKAEEMTYDWATELLKDYVPGIIENSAKMELFFCILNESIKMGDRLLLFSQSLFTLNLIEDFLERNYIPGTQSLWERNTSYYRLDGSTSALEREKLINEFNANPHVYLFLVSTRAGSLGINLVGANRVIVFDASWNPCHDTQAVCRVYRYGQKKPCFVYRFVMDYCLEKKIYDRQINKQGMADRVVDECNPDAVLSMKEITNLCWDNDEKEPEKKDLQQYKDKYLDVLMQKVIMEHPNTLSKEPFQHESLLVDRKEKKLSSAEKRLAQRGYELEKKAAAAPKPTTAYRTIRTADGTIIQRPVASVRPMQHGARWIPADVWRRQGMTAQEMTLPLDVVIPTNSAEKTNIVLKAGQRVMVLKSPKGIYMQLESGKIIAIKTSFKVGQKPAGAGADNKESPVGKKILGTRPQPPNLPGSLKNNSAITVIPKSGSRPMQKIITRPTLVGPNKLRPQVPGHKMHEFRPRQLTPGQRPFSVMRKVPAPQPRLARPNTASLVIKPREAKVEKESEEDDSPSSKMEVDNSDGETQVVDSSDDKRDDERAEDREEAPSEPREPRERPQTKAEAKPKQRPQPKPMKSEDSSSDVPSVDKAESSSPPARNNDPVSLLADEKFPNETTLEDRPRAEEKSSKISLLKNYRHRPAPKSAGESSLSRLERTASAVAAGGGGAPDFRRTLDDITHSYSPAPDERPGPKSRKKKPPPKKPDSESDDTSRETPSVGAKVAPAPAYAPPHPSSQIIPHPGLPTPTAPHAPTPHHSAPAVPHPGLPHAGLPHPGIPHGGHGAPHGYPAAPGAAGPEAAPQPYGHYPGYGAAGYAGGYPAAPSPYYAGYGAGYYPPYPAPYPPHPGAPPAPDPYLPAPPAAAPPPNHQW